MKRTFGILGSFLGSWIIFMALFCIIAPFLFPFGIWYGIRDIFNKIILFLPIGFILRFIYSSQDSKEEKIIQIIKETLIIMILINIPILSISIAYLIKDGSSYYGMVMKILLIAGLEILIYKAINRDGGQLDRVKKTWELLLYKLQRGSYILVRKYTRGVNGMKLKGKVAIVTDSISGLGKFIAELFADEGAKVVITGSDEERGKEIVHNIKAKGKDATYIPNNNSSPEGLKEIVARTIDEYGAVDILFNNVSIDSATSMEDINLDQWENIYRENIMAPLYLSKLVISIMEHQGNGIVINSFHTMEEHKDYAGVAYISSEYAICGLTKSSALQANTHVRVNAVLAGSMEMDINENRDRVGKIALFLATDDAYPVTGQLFRI